MVVVVSLRINQSRITDPKRHAAKLHEADVMLKFSINIAKLQMQGDRKFCFEHPATASSFNQKRVKAIMNMKGRQSMQSVLT